MRVWEDVGTRAVGGSGREARGEGAAAGGVRRDSREGPAMAREGKEGAASKGPSHTAPV